MESGCREPNVVECECVTAGSTSLDVLNEVQKAYEHRMELLDKVPCNKRMPMQVSVLKQWVCDLAAQNSLLARAVQDLEMEASIRLAAEQRKNNEMVCELRAELAVLRRRLARKDSDLRGLVEVLRRLRDLDYCSLDGIHFFEVTESDIFGNCDCEMRDITFGAANEVKVFNETLRKENCSKERDGSKKDAEVMAGMCCTAAEGGDWAPVKDYNCVLREEMLSYQERIKKMESNLKSSGEDVRALRKVNVGLREELHALRGVCVALGEQARAAALRGQFKDEIIREMRRQLKHAKAKTKEAAELISIKSRGSHDLEPPYERVTIACLRPRRATSRSLSDEGRSPRLIVSGDDMLSE